MSVSPFAATFAIPDTSEGRDSGGFGNGTPYSLGDESSDWKLFSIDENQIFDALGIQSESFVPEGRSTLAISRLGIHGVNGTIIANDLPPASLVAREDLSLLIIDGDYQLTDARNNLAEIDGLVVREYISPSGLVVQGTP
ncbi:MAG: hypothetical protein HOC79_02470, partial [Euryarchaeota archaeon]|nr:hypothetical protein [Euryarchaeota archaeon]